VKERSDPNQNQVDREQQHSNIFCHRRSFWREVRALARLKRDRLEKSQPAMFSVCW
jgi:hypothetical protein